MKKIKRVFLIILDSLGCGELYDAARFGDEGSNTLKSIASSPEFSADNMIAMGLGNIDGVDYLKKVSFPSAAVARLAELSNGKDTTIGHWEIAGVISENPLPTYPNGFPRDVLDEFEKRTGRGVICNKPYSGTDVIRDYGREHLESGSLIVYTSADSVFQIAAHEDIVPPEKLYEYCLAARDILAGEHGVGRVIARPFVGEYPNFKRTANRRDFSIAPPRDTMLDAISSNRLDVIAVGKISDIFSGRGITEVIRTHSNEEGMDAAIAAADRDFEGLCFVNLVDFDSSYGHRNDIDGYAAALARFDAALPKLVERLKEGDVLMISADHGCDPGTESTDHSREYVPLLIFGKDVRPSNLGTRKGFSDISATVCEMLGVSYDGAGESFADAIL